MESILDDCLALNMPQTHLLWHYRSRHESLIAFSNSRFYENQVYTFPSVNDRESRVRLVHVDGVFERGGKRTNRADAEAVVSELQRRAHDSADCVRSVGVVTFNISQQNLIQSASSGRTVRTPSPTGPSGPTAKGTPGAAPGKSPFRRPPTRFAGRWRSSSACPRRI